MIAARLDCGSDDQASTTSTKKDRMKLHRIVHRRRLDEPRRILALTGTLLRPGTRTATVMISTTFALDLAAVLLTTVALTVAAQFRVSIGPIPVTGHTLALVLAASLTTTPVAVAGSAVYVVAAVAGVPVLSGYKRVAGPAFFRLPSAGYVLAFPLATAAVGPACRAATLSARFDDLFYFSLALHGIVLTVGGIWLAWSSGRQAAFTQSAVFATGAVIKSLAAVAFLFAVHPLN